MAKAASKSYPPYPDVWSWSPQRSPTGGFTHARLRRMSDGDILASVTQHSGTTADVLGLGTFFGNRQFASVESAFSGRFPPPDDTDRPKLRDDLYVRSRGDGINSCSRGIYGALRIEDDKGRVVLEKTALVVLAAAKRSKVLTCEERSTGGFPYQVQPVVGRLLALEDGTFLVVDSESGLVLRFTDRLETHSTMLGRTLFMVDADFLNRRFREHLAKRNGNPDWREFQASLVDWAKMQRSQ